MNGCLGAFVDRALGPIVGMAVFLPVILAACTPVILVAAASGPAKYRDNVAARYASVFAWWMEQLKKL